MPSKSPKAVGAAGFVTSECTVWVPLPDAPLNRPVPPVTMYESTMVWVVGLVKQPVPWRARLIESPLAPLRVIVPELVLHPGVGGFARSIAKFADSLIFPRWVA